MTELLEKIKIHLDNPDSEDCPFCPGKEDKHEWKTFKGKDNSSSKLRESMNYPTRNEGVQEKGARPKDGVYPRQSGDTANDPLMLKGTDSIYNDAIYGDYGNEAHHCISGNEIMKGEALEKIIANENGKYKGQTGYTINNAANGVFLPSYPNQFKGAKGTWADKSDEKKYEIMKPAMASGQAHIGKHKGHEHAAGQDYPLAIKDELDALKKRILNKQEECPFCVEDDGKPKDPFVPPYKVNVWLDKLSKDIKTELKSPVEKWPYFISKYAKMYYEEKTKSDEPNNKPDFE